MFDRLFPKQSIEFSEKLWEKWFVWSNSRSLGAAVTPKVGLLLYGLDFQNIEYPGC